MKAAALEPGDFYLDRHRLIYLALSRLASAGTPADAVTLVEELQRVGQLDETGGAGYVVELLACVPHAEYLGYYAAQVREAAGRRRVIERAGEAIRLAYAAVEPERIAAVLDHAREAAALGDSGGRNLATAVLRSLADVPSEPLAWLWPGRIPLGKLTLLAGDPGLGKSFVTLDVAARVSSGKGWPDGGEEGGGGIEEGGGQVDPRSSILPPPVAAGDVILFGAEDDLADTVRPRLEAAGADLSRVTAVEGVRSGAGAARGFSLSADLPRLDAVLADRPDAKLVVIDPITAYCGGVDSHKNAEVRALLAPLSELAARRKVAVVAVTHLNKAAGGKAIYRAMGSLAYVAAARVGWVVAKDKDDPQRRLLLPVKNNLAPDAGGLAYRLSPAGPHAPCGSAVVAWEPGRVDMDADEALEAGRRGGGGGDGESGGGGDGLSMPRRNRADDFLEERLAKGPVPAAAVFRDAVGAGLTERMLREARKRLGVRTEKQGTGWVLKLDPDRQAGRDLSAAGDLFEDPFAGR
jgi:hypothetical protein